MATVATIQNGKRQLKPTTFFEARFQRALTRVAECDCPILILGEHGVGKRSVAALIHAQSNHFRGAFQEIDCSETNEQALRDALAGHGTVYLADVTDLNLPLQELIINSYFRADGSQTCRLLCGSSREPLNEVNFWRMREDFYYLVSAITLRIPPLRFRKSEILSIADELLTIYSKQFDRPKPVLCKEIVEHLMEHTWPENLNELQTAIKTFVAIDDQSVSLAALKAAASTAKANGQRKLPSLKEAARAASTQIERQLISEVLATTGGNRKRAADKLGISYKALLYNLKQVEEEYQPLPDKNGVA